MSSFQLITRPYKRRFGRKEFSCGKPSLDNYLLRNATRDVRSGACTCFVMVNADQQVLAYYTLSAESIDKEDVPAEYAKRINYDSIPVILLGRLAVDNSIKGQ